MTTYGMAMCPKCYGFGIELTKAELYDMKLQAMRSALYQKDIVVQIEITSDRKSCYYCKGTGWHFVNSDLTTKNVLPSQVIKRW